MDISTIGSTADAIYGAIGGTNTITDDAGNVLTVSDYFLRVISDYVQLYDHWYDLWRSCNRNDDLAGALEAFDKMSAILRTLETMNYTVVPETNRDWLR